MENGFRRIVSGNKARFRDDELNLELDLVYVTDNIIIMVSNSGLFMLPFGSLLTILHESRDILHQHSKEYTEIDERMRRSSWITVIRVTTGYSICGWTPQDFSVFGFIK